MIQPTNPMNELSETALPVPLCRACLSNLKSHLQPLFFVRRIWWKLIHHDILFKILLFAPVWWPFKLSVWKTSPKCRHIYLVSTLVTTMFHHWIIQWSQSANKLLQIQTKIWGVNIDRRGLIVEQSEGWYIFPSLYQESISHLLGSFSTVSYHYRPYHQWLWSYFFA